MNFGVLFYQWKHYSDNLKKGLSYMHTWSSEGSKDKKGGCTVKALVPKDICIDIESSLNKVELLI